MFENSVMLSQLSAGSGVDAVQTRVRHLESMVAAMSAQRSTVSSPADLQGGVTFKSFLGSTTPPPKMQPLVGNAASQKEAVQPLVQKYCSQYNVDPALVNAVIRQESGFNPNAVSSCGARGLMQLMPTTAQGLGVSNAFDPEQNIQGGVKHLSGLLQKYQGNVALALASYNAGGGAVDKYNGIPPYAETQNYVRKILVAYLAAKNNG